VAETPDKQIQVDKEPVAPQGASSRVPAIIVSLSVLAVISAATAYAVPNFNGFAEQSPHEMASAPIPDPTVSATLKDIQSAQQRNASALQENGAALQQNTGMLQQSAATLESLRQGFTAQQTNLKAISNQLSSLIARVDSLQNAVTPLTTSSIPQPNARARPVRTSRKKTSRLPDKPVGPVSIGGAPLNPTPASGAGGERFSAADARNFGAARGDAGLER